MPKKTIQNSVLSINAVEGTVSVTHADGSVETKQIPVKEVIVSKPLCNVGMSAQATINLGNYESAKVTVSLHVPAEYEEIEDVYTFISDWVNRKMTKMTNEIKGITTE